EEEYEKGHIEGAICIPNESIGAERPDALPDSHRQILVYGDGGPGSKEAAHKLFDLGYANVCEFGGIGEPEWQGRTVSGRDDVEDSEAIRPRAVLVIDVREKRFYASLEATAAVSAFVEKLNPAPLKIEMGDSENGEMSGLLPWGLPDAGKRMTAVAGDFILREGNRIALCYDENEGDFTRLARIGNVSKEEILGAFGTSGEPFSASFSLEWGE
ncbi:MAG: hypothetical protein ILO68_06075, partial [Clostridia bacterium]|nr:hypothetical protein [Clostridia bacterium]